MLRFSEYLNERSDHNNRVRVISGWTVVMTLHGVDRDKERMNTLDDDKWNSFFERVVKKINGFKTANSGEYLYSSIGLKINTVLNVDVEKKQLRVTLRQFTMPTVLQVRELHVLAPTLTKLFLLLKV